MNKGVKFRAYPNKNQQNLINQTLISTVGHTGIYACGHCVRRTGKVTC